MVKRRDTACHCGWIWDNFHICLKLDERTMRKIEPVKKRKSRASGDTRTHSEKMREHYLTVNSTAMRSRNEKIIELYSGGKTIREIESEIDVSQKTIMKVLHEARDEGKVTIRPAAKRTARG